MTVKSLNEQKENGMVNCTWFDMNNRIRSDEFEYAMLETANSMASLRKFSCSELDTKHTTFLQNLLEKEYWTLSEFEELARDHGLLPIGAEKTINEWIFEQYDKPLLDKQYGYHLSPSIIGMLKPKLDAKH